MTATETQHIVVSQIRAHGHLSDFGEEMLAADLAFVAEAQAKLADPDVERVPVIEPVFIIGTGRTASTTMHRLLAHHFQVASVAQAWTLERRPSDAARERVRDLIVRGDAQAPWYPLSHEHQIDDPAEDHHFDRFVMGTGWWLTHYQGADDFLSGWIYENGAAELANQRACAELLGARGRRWCFRNPVHLTRLPALFEEFPDARVIYMERSSAQVFSGLIRMIGGARATRTDLLDLGALRPLVDLYTNVAPLIAEEAFASGAVPLERVQRVQFSDFVRNPHGTVAALLEWLG